MISASFPGFLVAGAVLAAIPVVLHLLSRRPPARRPLPTARFLTRDARTLLQLQRRPTDVVLMLTRVAFGLALAAAFAGLTWTPQRSGSARIVLLDAGADTLADWDGALASVRAAVSDAAPGVEPVVVAYGLDEGSAVIGVEELDRLEPGTGPATAETGLRALRRASAAGRFREAEVTWIVRPSWRVWTRSFGLLRPELWPGRATLRPLPVRSIPEAAGGGRAASAGGLDTPIAWLEGSASAEALGRALEASDARVVTAVDEGDPPPDRIYAEGVSGARLERLLDRAREGSTLVLSGPIGPAATELPWVSSGSGEGAPSPIVLSPHTSVGSPVSRFPGAPASDARVVAVFDDATPAAVARSLDEGCVVYLAARIADPGLTAAAEYPMVLETLARGCVDGVSDDGAMDVGGRAALERGDLPASVDIADLVASDGYPLTRWLVLLAMTLFALELGLTRGARAGVRGRRARVEGDRA